MFFQFKSTFNKTELTEPDDQFYKRKKLCLIRDHQHNKKSFF